MTIQEKNGPATVAAGQGTYKDPQCSRTVSRSGTAVNDAQLHLPFVADTRREASRRIRAASHALRGQVLGWFVGRGQHGGTDEECQLALGMKTQTETPRRNELTKMGLLIDSGRRRPTSSGRPATVWIVSTAAAGGGDR